MYVLHKWISMYIILTTCYTDYKWIWLAHETWTYYIRKQNGIPLVKMQMPRKGRPFLLHMWHRSCYSSCKPGDESWMYEWRMNQTVLTISGNIHGNLWLINPVTLSKIMAATVNHVEWLLQLKIYVIININTLAISHIWKHTQCRFFF